MEASEATDALRVQIVKVDTVTLDGEGSRENAPMARMVLIARMDQIVKVDTVVLGSAQTA